MHKRPYTSYNIFFLIPYVIWIVIGGILYLTFPDKHDIFFWVNTHYNDALDVIMYCATWLGEGITITVLALLLLVFPCCRNWWYVVSAAACTIIPAELTQFVKHIVDNPRPINYFHNAEWIHTVSGWPILMLNSFPSGHTTGAFSFFCFLSFLLPAKLKWMAIIFFMLALTVGYSRMYLAAHFYEDVYGGSIMGGTVTILVFSVMKKYENVFFKKVQQ